MTTKWKWLKCLGLSPIMLTLRVAPVHFSKALNERGSPSCNEDTSCIPSDKLYSQISLVIPEKIGQQKSAQSTTLYSTGTLSDLSLLVFIGTTAWCSSEVREKTPELGKKNLSQPELTASLSPSLTINALHIFTAPILLAHLFYHSIMFMRLPLFHIIYSSIYLPRPCISGRGTQYRCASRLLVDKKMQ